MPDIVRFFIDNPSFAFAYGEMVRMFADKQHTEPNFKLNLLLKLNELTRTQYASPKTSRNVFKIPLHSNRFDHSLVCAYCRETVHHPMVLICGDTFCRRCLGDTLECHICPLYSREGSKDSLVITKVTELLFPEYMETCSFIDQAMASMETGEYLQAVEILNRVIESHPKHTRALGHRAECFLNLDRPTEAIKDAETIQKLNPLWPKYYLYKGIALNRMGRYLEALECLFAGFSACPHCDRAINEISQIVDEQLTDQDVENFKRIAGHVFTHGSNICNALRQLPIELLEAIPVTSWTLPVILNGCCNGDEETEEFSFEFLPNRGLRCDPLDAKDPPNEAISPISICEVTTLDQTMRNQLWHEFNCSLCYQIFWDPVTTPCGHTFCKACIERSLDFMLHCPLCKCSLELFLSQPERGKTQMIDRLSRMLFPDQMSERECNYIVELELAKRVGLDPSVELSVMVCMTAFPGMQHPLHIFEAQYRYMIRTAWAGSRRFAMFCPYEKDPFYMHEVGTLLLIRSVNSLPDGRLLVSTSGQQRIRRLQTKIGDGLRKITWEPYEDVPLADEACELRYHQGMHELFGKLALWFAQQAPDTRSQIIRNYGNMPVMTAQEGGVPPTWLWWLIQVLPLAEECRYKGLSCRNSKQRLDCLSSVLNKLLLSQMQSTATSNKTSSS